MREKLLVIDDDRSLTEMLAQRLGPRGFDILIARSGKDGLKIAYENHPDLVILDVMMPDMDGWETCQRLREMSDVPILLLTGQASDEDVVRGFQLGADDFVRKPFNLKELEGRIRAILKRAGGTERDASQVYDDGILRIDLDRGQVFREGKPIHLTSTEYNLLRCLVRNQGSLVPHEEILAEVWGPSYVNANACLSLYIRYVRAKIEQNPGEPHYIRTKWGAGYWFAPAPHAK